MLVILVFITFISHGCASVFVLEQYDVVDAEQLVLFHGEVGVLDLLLQQVRLVAVRFAVHRCAVVVLDLDAPELELLVSELWLVAFDEVHQPGGAGFLAEVLRSVREEEGAEAGPVVVLGAVELRQLLLKARLLDRLPLCVVAEVDPRRGALAGGQGFCREVFAENAGEVFWIVQSVAVRGDVSRGEHLVSVQSRRQVEAAVAEGEVVFVLVVERGQVAFDCRLVVLDGRVVVDRPVPQAIEEVLVRFRFQERLFGSRVLMLELLSFVLERFVREADLVVGAVHGVVQVVVHGVEVVSRVEKVLVLFAGEVLPLKGVFDDVFDALCHCFYPQLFRISFNFSIKVLVSGLKRICCSSERTLLSASQKRLSP